MRKTLIPVGLLLTAVLGSDCKCGDSLGSAVGELELALCDRDACPCRVLAREDSTVAFGSPSPGGVARRTLLLRNLNQPRILKITGLEVTGGDVFFISAVSKRQSEDASAAVESHDMSGGPLVLKDAEVGEVELAFQPSAAGELSATLTVYSESVSRPSWDVTLVGGGGASEVCVPSGACGDGSEIDFGVFQDSEIAYDPAAGAAVALGTEKVTITNPGTTELYAAVELNDSAGGVFRLADVGCTVVPPGGSIDITVEYRPSTAGEHTGSLRINALREPEYIQLVGRVIGAHVCFRTEDDQPDDTLLQFGDAPLYTTPVNAEPPETRRVWVRNCGYDANLVITDLQMAPNTAPEFATTAMPWSQTAPLAPSDEVEVPVTLAPAAGTPVGSMPQGGLMFASNDLRRPTAILSLNSRIGAPEQCVLVASPSPLDFGWVASDEVGLGTECPAPPMPCPPGVADPKISRVMDLTFVNVGGRDCTNIALGPITFDEASTDVFAIRNNPNGAPFTLAAGASSQPVEMLFVRDPSDNPTNHFGKLGYASPDMPISPLDVDLRAKGGGSPSCDVQFRPVSPPSLFCPYDTLNFGNVNIGQDKTIDLQVINVGSETCNITDIGPIVGTAAVFTFPTTPLTIPVNAFSVIPVTFAPLPPSGDPFDQIPFLCGTNGITMTVNSGTGGTTEPRSVAFAGMGKPPSIDVIPGEIDFGEVTVGCCSATERVAVHNSGLTVLDLDSITVFGGSGSDFAIVQPAGDMSLSPGEHTEFTARYCASSVGEASDVIEIRGHDDNGNEEFFTVSMTGTGTTDSTGDDRFQQPTRPKVDVLWVVDDSGSMRDDQDALANNFDAFISQAVTLDTDYHLGVTNTDGQTEWSGRLYACRGNPKWITDLQPRDEQRNQFRCNVKVSEADDSRPNTDSKESALQAARAAFEYPNIGDWNTMTSGPFYREDAKLYIIMVTDEVDQSDGSADLYVDFFRSLKGVGNPDLLNISAISGTPPDGCASAEANQPGYDVVTAIGGQFRSICTADWSDLISSLGLDVFHARAQFPLARPATAATLSVRVCPGACPENPLTCPVVPQNATNGWTFDGSVNAVTFHGDAVPGPGQCVAITYTAICYQ